MVNTNNDTNQDDVEITTEEAHTEFSDPDLDTSEASHKDIISSLREKLKASEAGRKEAQEEMQRIKADFLNAKRRLEEERLRDKNRSVLNHVEALIPLCDSFMLAMSDKATWEKADPQWRKGVEGISSQLEQLLRTYRVARLEPLGATFNPREHEALSMTPTTDNAAHDTVVNVIQPGYEITYTDGTKELVRPARVSIGVFEEK
jgi:molecular chaperone GrpE